MFHINPSCRPREGCGLHREMVKEERTGGTMVAVPVRGAGCIKSYTRKKDGSIVVLPSP